jgi:hypothetical protein
LRFGQVFPQPSVSPAVSLYQSFNFFALSTLYLNCPSTTLIASRVGRMVHRNIRSEVLNYRQTIADCTVTVSHG